jgi:nitrite reductase/ring-hydroxylating ferredoxin subunit/uncharacterized membrane protein
MITQTAERIPGLKQAGQRLAHSIHAAVLDGGDLTRTLADQLHGSRLGHPLHPALVAIPIGAWSLAAMFDLYAGLSDDDFAMRASDSLIALGVAAAIPTALAGLTDYSAIDDDAAAIGAAHGLLNSAGLGLYLMSLWSRAKGERIRGVLLSTAGLAIVGTSASLGGDLIYKYRVGVSHAPPATEPQNWTSVLKTGDIGEHGRRRVEIDGTPVLIYRDGSEVYAIGAVCNHAGGPLDEGTFEGYCVTCPWHQSVFDVRDGHVVHGPAAQPQPRYQARIRAGQIEIRCAPPPGSTATEAERASRNGERTRAVGR